MDELTNLTLENLSAIRGDVKKPAYERAALSAGILHIGLGNFHRAHQAWYLHSLFEQGLSTDWAIVGAGVRAGDARMRDTLAAQDYLTTLIELDPSGMSAEICGSMVEMIALTPRLMPEA